jgi:hypothetical protein
MYNLESLSYSLFWCGLIAVAIASLPYVLAGWGWRVIVHFAATSAGTVTVSERQPLQRALGVVALPLVKAELKAEAEVG